MANEENINSEELKIQGLLNQYLRLKISANGLTVEEQHLDENSLTAFVEGNLGNRETQPIINHLVSCTFCRHVTAQLVKLEVAFADEALHPVVSENQPTKVSEVLSGLLSRIFGNNEGAVFAHQEKEESEEQKNSEEEKN